MVGRALASPVNPKADIERSPGRFWAANEMKAMMAYMLTHYDMKMEHDGEVPKETWFGFAVIPDRNARMVIRKREAPVY